MTAEEAVLRARKYTRVQVSQFSISQGVFKHIHCKPECKLSSSLDNSFQRTSCALQSNSCPHPGHMR